MIDDREVAVIPGVRATIGDYGGSLKGSAMLKT